MQDLAHSMHTDRQGLVLSISSQFWTSALEKSAFLLHFEGTFMLGLVLSAVAGFLCLFFAVGFFILKKGFAALTQAVSALQPKRRVPAAEPQVRGTAGAPSKPCLVPTQPS